MTKVFTSTFFPQILRDVLLSLRRVRKKLKRSLTFDTALISFRIMFIIRLV